MKWTQIIVNKMLCRIPSKQRVSSWRKYGNMKNNIKMNKVYSAYGRSSKKIKMMVGLIATNKTDNKLITCGHSHAS